MTLQVFGFTTQAFFKTQTLWYKLSTFEQYVNNMWTLCFCMNINSKSCVGNEVNAVNEKAYPVIWKQPTWLLHPRD